MFNKKGQAALEFLSTYGWAFLVVLVMIGALSYFGVLNPSNFVPENCNFGSSLSCSGGYGMSYYENATGGEQDSTIQFEITNSMPNSMEIIKIEIKEKSETKWIDVTGNSTWEIAGAINTTLNSQESDQLNIVIDTGANVDFLSELAGDKKTILFDIQYYKAGSTILSAMQGSITSTVVDLT